MGAMFRFLKPSADDVAHFRERQSNTELTYDSTGSTRAMPERRPPECDQGYVVDHNRVQLGSGPRTFEVACRALEAWKMFDVGWVELFPARERTQVDDVVAVLARAPGMWTLNAARVLYRIDDDGPMRRSGFAYGTLEDHVESGEERFSIEWNREDNSVWYDLLAFSRPRHPLVRLLRPYARVLQRRFARDSLAAMARAVSQSSNVKPN